MQSRNGENLKLSYEHIKSSINNDTREKNRLEKMLVLKPDDRYSKLLLSSTNRNIARSEEELNQFIKSLTLKDCCAMTLFANKIEIKKSGVPEELHFILGLTNKA